VAPSPTKPKVKPVKVCVFYVIEAALIKLAADQGQE
jgi:hypothetical protein